MRAIAIVCLLFATSCAVRVWPPEFAFGGATVGTNCHKDGHCTDETSSNTPATELLDFVLMLLDAVPGVEINRLSLVEDPPAHHTHPTEEPRVIWEPNITETPGDTILWDFDDNTLIDTY